MNPREKNPSSKNLATFLSSSRLKSGMTSHNFSSENPSFRKLSSANIDAFPSRAESRQLEPKLSQNLCPRHAKVTDMLCVDCGVSICLDCALFEDHKEHKIENHQSFVDSSAQISQLKDKIYKMQKSLADAGHSFRERLETARTQRRSEVIFAFSELAKELERSRTKSLVDVSDYFEHIATSFKTLKNKVNNRINEIAELLCKPTDDECRPDKLRRELRNLKSVISSESFARPIGLKTLDLTFNQEAIRVIQNFCTLSTDANYKASKIVHPEEEDNLFQSFSSMVGDIKESLEIGHHLRPDNHLTIGFEFDEEIKDPTSKRPFELSHSFDDDNNSHKSDRKRNRSKANSNLNSKIGTLSNSYNDQAVSLYQQRAEKGQVTKSEPQKELRTSATMRTFSKSPARQEETHLPSSKHQNSKSPFNKGLRRIATLQSIDITKSQIKKTRILAEDFQSHNTVSANKQAGRERAIQIINGAIATRTKVVDLSNFGLDDHFFTINTPLIRSLKSIRHLIVNNNSIRDTGFKQILQSVIDLKIEAISVCGNLLENRSVEFLVDFSKHNGFLKTLNLKKNRFDLKSDTLKARIDYLQKKGISIVL